MNKELVKTPYLSDSVVVAIQNADRVRENLQQALNDLATAQQTRSEALAAQHDETAEQLDHALANIVVVEQRMADELNSPEAALRTAQGAEAQLALAKVLPLISEKQQTALLSDRQRSETLRYVALARYLLQAAGVDDSRGKQSKSEATTSESGTLERSLSDALLLDSAVFSQADDQARIAEFKEQLVVLARQLEDDRAQFEQAAVARDVTKMRVAQLRQAQQVVHDALKRADPADSDERLQRLRAKLAQLVAVQEQLRTLESSERLESLRIRVRATVEQIVALVDAKRREMTTRLLDRLTVSLRAQLNKQRDTAAEAGAELEAALALLEQRQQEYEERVDNRIRNTLDTINAMEDELENAHEMYAMALEELADAEPLASDMSLWPETLLGADLFDAADESAAEDALRQQLVAALAKFDIEQLKLEPARADEIDAKTGKHKSCTPPFVASQYQRALSHYVNDGFAALPGVMLLWEPGTGKTAGSVLAAVENLRTRLVVGNGERKKAGAVDVLILGFTEDNLNDFLNTTKRTLESHLGADSYEIVKESGNIKAGDVSLRLRIRGADGEWRNAAIAVQRYSVGAARARDMSLDPDGIMLLDEAHFMATRDVPTESTNRKQVLATVTAWEKRVLDFTGTKLLLTATPSGAKRDPEMLLALLKYLPPERGVKSSADKRDVRAHKKWFRERADGLGYEWSSDAARDEFVRDWLRARISFISLRFDERVFPRVTARCAGANGDEQCVYEAPSVEQVTSGKPIVLADTLPKLSAAEQKAERMLDYANMVPMLVRVPLVDKDAAAFVKGANSASVNTRNPELVGCTGRRLAEMSDAEVAQCADFAHYGHKNGGGKWASGGGFDSESKAAAIRGVIDIVREQSGPTRHIVIASGYEGASRRYFQSAFRDAFLKKHKPAKGGKAAPSFVRVEKANVRDEKAAAALAGKPARRFASLTGTTYAGSSAAKTSGEKQRMKEIFFSDANADGSLIEVLVVDASMLTGFDGKGATHLHIASPVLNQQQAWSRILRRCAQPVDRASVFVYTYAGYVPAASDAGDDEGVAAGSKKKVASGKQHLLITPDELVLEALRRKRQKTQKVDLMRDVMRANAYDRYFFAEYSSGGTLSATGGGSEDAADERIEPLTRAEHVVFRTLLDKVHAASREPTRTERARANIAGGAGSVDDSDDDFEQGDKTMRFAAKFFVGEPWRAAAPHLFDRDGKMHSDDGAAQRGKSARILQTLAKVADSNSLPDIALIRSFSQQMLSDKQRRGVLMLLERKAASTPPQMLRSYDNVYDRIVDANDYYRDIIEKTVAVSKEMIDQTASVARFTADVAKSARVEERRPTKRQEKLADADDETPLLTSDKEDDDVDEEEDRDEEQKMVPAPTDKSLLLFSESSDDEDDDDDDDNDDDNDVSDRTFGNNATPYAAATPLAGPPESKSSRSGPSASAASQLQSSLNDNADFSVKDSKNSDETLLKFAPKELEDSEAVRSLTSQDLLNIIADSTDRSYSPGTIVPGAARAAVQQHPAIVERAKTDKTLMEKIGDMFDYRNLGNMLLPATQSGSQVGGDN